jgi:hypothetical protein
VPFLFQVLPPSQIYISSIEFELAARSGTAEARRWASYIYWRVGEIRMKTAGYGQQRQIHPL